jgi:hypothetical protein
MSLNISDDVKALMEERGIKEEDVMEVIAYGEEGDKLVDETEEICLAKKRINEVTFYAVYKANGENCEVMNTYSHRIGLSEDQ